MSISSEQVRKEHYPLLNAYQDDLAYRILEGYEELVTYFAGTVGRRWEIEAIYDEALNILPPLGWRGDTFYDRLGRAAQGVTAINPLPAVGADPPCTRSTRRHAQEYATLPRLRRAALLE